MKRAIVLGTLLAACGGGATPIDGGAPEDASPAGIDAPIGTDDAAPSCDPITTPTQQAIVLDVSLANFETDLLRLEAVTLAGTGRICVSRGPPSRQIIAVAELVEGSVYELRFTAAGYVPFTFHGEVTGGVLHSRAPGVGPEGVVMVRGAVLGPATPVASGSLEIVPPRAAVRPSTDDLFYAIDGVWRVARRSGGTIAVTELGVAAPTWDTLQQRPRFTPDGGIVFLASDAPRPSFQSCSAVRAATGEVLARDLLRGLCTVAGEPTFAASGAVGIVGDELSGEWVVLEWDAAGLRESRRLSGTGRFQRMLDATGAHILREDDRGNPIIHEIATSAEASPSRASGTLGRDFARVLGARGDYTVFGDGASSAGPLCPSGCDLAIEPVGAPVVPVANAVRAWAMSSIADVLAYATASGELHRFDVATASDTTVAVDAFDPDSVMASGDAFVTVGASGVQVTAISTGEVRLTVPGIFPSAPFAGIEPPPATAGAIAEGVVLLRTCIEMDCPAVVVDLRSFTATTSHDHPYRRGERAWYRDAAGSLAAGPSTEATGRWSFFAGDDAVMGDDTLTPAGARFPCAPFVWGELWVCAE